MIYPSKICEQCSTTFTNTAKRSRKGWEKQKYCSRTCNGLAQRIDTDSHVCKQCNATFYKRKNTSVATWESQLFCSKTCASVGKEVTHLLSYQYKAGNKSGTRFTSENTTGELNAKWKGDDASYFAKHIWMNNHFGRPQKCDHCATKEKRMYHWANISGTYKRERMDWLRLCVPCHKSYDIKALGGKIRARPVKQQPSKACLECGKTFPKTPKESHVQWVGRNYCGRKCGSAVSGRARFGIRQSDATRALKSQKLVERWQRPEWREMMSTKMLGNQYARKLER